MTKMLKKAVVFLLFAILIGGFVWTMIPQNVSLEGLSQVRVAKVGPVIITPEHFERTYQRTLDSLSAKAQRRITPQQAQMFGLPERVLQGLIQEAALDVDAGNLGLGLSTDGLRETITGNEAFRDKSGNFSQANYDRFLQRIGYSAPAFEYEYKGDLVRRQIQGLFSTSGVVPAVLLDAFNRYLNEHRTIAYFTLGPAAAGTIEAPSDAALRSFFDNRKVQYMAPEYRKVSVVAITPAIAESRVAVTDEEVKADYDAKAASYAVPERRKIDIIAFQTKEAAEAASAALAQNHDFAAAAKSAGFTEADVALGSLSKKELADKFAANDAILNAAFSLNKDEVSQPIDGPLSWVIVRVTDITPGQEKSFDEVKDRIRASLAKAKGAGELAKLVKAFEEERTAGVPIEEAAKKLNLAIEQVVLGAQGNSEDGKPVTLTSVPAQVLAAGAFKSDVGVENDVLRLQGGGYAWYDVTGITKSKQKSFDDVKAQVEADWRKDQIRTKLAEKARDLAGRLNKGEPIDDVAKSVGAEVKTTQPVKRDATVEGLPPTAAGQAFSLAEGVASSAAGTDAESRTVLQVAKVTAPGPLNALEAKQLTEKLAGMVSEDNFAAYLAGVEKAAGVSIDRKTFSAAAGGGYDTAQ
jgi:peptidyl-prolyl cis-trans isomerase D